MQCNTENSNGIFDFTLPKGTDFTFLINVKEDGEPKDLENAEFKMQIKRSANHEALIDVTLEKLENSIIAKITHEQSNNLNSYGSYYAKTNAFYYDVLMFENERIERILVGRIDLSPTITEVK